MEINGKNDTTKFNMNFFSYFILNISFFPRFNFNNEQ